LLESGVAIKASDASALEYKLLRLLSSPTTLAAMRERMGGIAKPDAAARTLSIISQTLNAS
jgi:processive 1,2-diacylglycerol beta-glucosyltransferase